MFCGTLLRSKNACSSKMFFFEPSCPALWHICWRVSPRSGCFPFFLFFVSTEENPLKTSKAKRAVMIICQEAMFLTWERRRRQVFNWSLHELSRAQTLSVYHRRMEHDDFYVAFSDCPRQLCHLAVMTLSSPNWDIKYLFVLRRELCPDSFPKKPVFVGTRTLYLTSLWSLLTKNY